jgi:hypothetical protein
MRDAAPRDWQRWRVTVTARAVAGPERGRFARRPLAAAPAGCAEQPGPDGIRHGLVERVRREIAAGTYDTEEKWLAAEEALLRRVAQGV